MNLHGKPVSAAELYEARVLRDAGHYRAQRRFGPQGHEELEPPGNPDALRALVRQPRVLVYAVTAAGRSVCVTPRVLEIYDACVAGALPWGDEPRPVVVNEEKRRPWS